MELSHIYHLYRRAGFGIAPTQAQSLVSLTKDEVVNRLLNASNRSTRLEIDLSAFDEFFEEYPAPKFGEFKKVLQKNKHLKFDLNRAWLERLFDPEEELRERMTLFWSNVFVCKDYVVSHMQQFNNTLREHALGNFREFVVAVSKEPSMIKYLDTNKNKKDHPNENFARELMELFTLGVGNYTESDVKEAARAFTGYNYRLTGEFHFQSANHDFGEKDFLGWKADLSGDDVIAIICNQKACAKFICTKLYRYFVNEIPDNKRIDELIGVFYPAYDIRMVMEYMLKADWFYNEEHIGTKIKSPIDLLTSINKVVPFRFAEEKEHIFIQRITGQLLFNPPNVSGWKGGRDWINTNTLMIRLKLPSIFLGNGYVPGLERPLRAAGRTFGDRLRIQKKWAEFDDGYGSLSPHEMIEALCAVELEEGTLKLLRTEKNLNKRDFGIQLMSLPEFQLT